MNNIGGKGFVCVVVFLFISSGMATYSVANKKDEYVNYIEKHELWDKNYFSNVLNDKNSSISILEETIFYEDFEGDWPGDWICLDEDVRSGEDYWGDNNYRAYTGSWSGYCADEGDVQGQYYDNYMWAKMYRSINLSGYDSATLSYYYWLDSETDYDYLRVGYYEDGSWNRPNNYSGNSSGWVNDTLSIPTTATWVGFLFESDESITDEGAYLDEVKLTGIPSAQADLIVQAIWIVPDPPPAGDYYTAAIQIKNQGVGDAVGNFFLEFWFDDNYQGHVYIDGLTAGSSYTAYWYSMTWPQDTNEHVIKGIVDPDNTIPESNESNNELSESFLAYRTINFYADPTGGGTITFNGTNYSNGESTTKIDDIYPVTANPASGYQFSYWTTTNGVNVTDQYSQSTNATVNDDGSIKAWFINYDYPTVQTNDATNIGITSATLNGQIINDGGESCQIRFRYRIYGSGTWIYPSDWHGSYNSGQTFSEGINGLNSDTTYEFQAGAKNSAGETWGIAKYFTTDPSEIPVIELTPSSHNFGKIVEDECSIEKIFTLTNVGTGTATGTVYLSGSNPDHFIITDGSGSFTLSAGQTKTVMVKFCPTSEGSKSASLFANGDSPCNNDESSLTGEGCWKPFYFIHITDPHVRPDQVDVWEEDIKKLRNMNLEPYNGPPDFVLCTGDLVEWGFSSYYEALLDCLYGVKPFFYIDLAENIPIYFCPGNHDERIDTDFSNYYDKIGPDFLSVSRKNCAIFSLNSGKDTPIWDWIGDPRIPEGDGIKDYYTNELTDFSNAIINSDKEIKIVMFHHPYEANNNPDDLDGEFIDGRDEFIGLCNNYNVDMVFCGHIHEVDASDGTLKIGEDTDQINTRSIANKGGNYYRIIKVNPIENHYKVDSMKAFDSVLSGDIFSCSMENSMTTVDIVDELGNHNGPIERGGIETQIPMSTYSVWELQNDTYGINTTYTEFMLDRNDSKNYTITINGLSDDNINVTFFTSIMGGNWTKAKYVNVTMYNGSIGTIYANDSIFNYSMKIVDPDRSTRIVNPSSIEENIAPEVINIPEGPTDIFPGQACNYSATANDPNNDDIYYWFDWGDGTNSSWIGPYNSNETCISNHSWDINGTYEIRVKSKDDYSLEGNWSENLTVNVKTQIIDWWPMFHHDLQHTGFSTSKAPVTNNTLWTYTTGEDVFTSPAVFDDKVFIGSWDTKLYCLNASNGAHIWNTTINFLSLSSPAVYDSKVYIGGLQLYCLDALTGEILYNSSEGYFFDSSPSIAYGKVYIASEPEGKIYCFNANNLDHIWNYSTQDDITLSSPAVYEEKIYIPSKDHYIYCLDALNGTLIWSYDIGGAFSSPTAYNGKIYIGSWDGNLYCLNAANGSLIWNYTSFRTDTTPAIAYGNVYFGNNWPGIYCIDAETGNYKWSYMDDIMGWFDSSPAVADEKVYIGSYWEGKYNYLYCLNAFTGESIWNYSFYSGVRSSPAIANGRVYVGSNDNNVYCFGTPYNIVYVDDDFNASTPGLHVTHFDNIQDGIDAVDMNGTVYVYNGTYYENIIINKTINLQGENSVSTIIDGSGLGHVVYLNNDGINFYEFTVRNSGILENDSGIKLNSNNNVIFNNKISSNKYGISSNINITQNDSGWKSPSSTGKVYNDWTNPSNAYSSNDQYTTAEGLYMEQDYYDFNFNIPNNSVIKGIELAIEGHGDGVGNYIKAKIYSASAGLWEDNDGWMVLGDNGVDAIATYGGSSELWDLTWTPSDFSNANFQMMITTFSRPDKLYVDHIQLKIYYELLFPLSNNSLIFHNNFINNPQNVYDQCSNTWDNGYPSGGNYWDDYLGVDNYSGLGQNISGSDGIGDIPYNIPGGENQDMYPLIHPYGSLQIEKLLIKWNFVSLPFNHSVNLIDLMILFNNSYYSWQEAIDNNFILGFIYGWNRTSQNYDLVNTLNSGFGYWMYAYKNCEVWTTINKDIAEDNLITDFLTEWNLIGLPDDELVNKENLIVYYNETEYTWQEAVNNSFVVNFICLWNETIQNYEITDILIPGKAYWMYAYVDCRLLKPI